MEQGHSEKAQKNQTGSGRINRRTGITSFSSMAQHKKLGRFLMGLANEISVNVTLGFHEVGKSFSTQLANLSTVISAQGVSQIAGTFEGKPSNFRDWIKQIEKYVPLAGGR